MDQTTWNFIFIGITFGVYITIAIWSRAASTKEYYTASGSVSPFANGMATAAVDVRSHFYFHGGGLQLPAMEHQNFLWDGPGVCSPDHPDGPLSAKIRQGYHS